MTTDQLQSFLQLRSKVDKLREQLHKAQGSHQSLLDRLKTEFDCGSLKQGESELAKLDKQIKKLSNKEQEMLEAFQETWTDKLEGVE